jgi:hypothetical protein
VSWFKPAVGELGEFWLAGVELGELVLARSGGAG